MTTTFGARLKQERARLGLTQAQLAVKAGCHRRSVVNYESGTRNPDARFLVAIAGLKVDVNFLLTGHPRVERPIEDVIRQISETNQVLVAALQELNTAMGRQL